MQKLYAKKLSAKTEKENIEIDNNHVFELASIEARVKCINDSNLNEKFNKFSEGRIVLGTYLEDGQNIEAREQLKSSIYLAGEVLEFLFAKLKKLTN